MNWVIKILIILLSIGILVSATFMFILLGKMINPIENNDYDQIHLLIAIVCLIICIVGQCCIICCCNTKD